MTQSPENVAGMRAARVIEVRHAVTGELLRVTSARLIGAVPTGVSCIMRSGCVVVVCDEERFDVRRPAAVSLAVHAAPPFDQGMLKFRGARKIRNLTIPDRSEWPSKHELLVRPAAIELDVHLIDARGAAVLGASPSVHGTGASDVVPCREVDPDDPRQAGHYRTGARFWSAEYNAGEIRVAGLRTPLCLSYRTRVERRRLVLPDDLVDAG